MKETYVVWLNGKLLYARENTIEVILTDFYLPETGYQPGEYIGVVDIPVEIRHEYKFILDPQSKRDNPRLLSFPQDDPVFDWQNATGDEEQIAEMKSKMLFFPVRGITVEERNKLSLPGLPKNVWIEECFRLGINPLDIIVKKFPGWKWVCEYRREASERSANTWVDYAGKHGKYFAFGSDYPPLFTRLVAEQIA